jgi:hypothetical protein
MLELSLNKTVDWSCHVDEADNRILGTPCLNDMIIAADDKVEELGLDLPHSRHLMTWQGYPKRYSH